MKGQEVLNQFEAKREEMYRKQLNGDFDITANDFRESFLRGVEKGENHKFQNDSHVK